MYSGTAVGDFREARTSCRRCKCVTARGILWLCYPKARALGTDLNRDVVRAVAAKVGLQTVALVAVDGVWSALRCTRTTRTWT